MLVGLDLLWRINSIPKALAGDTKDAAWALCDALTKHSLGENEDSEDFFLPLVEQPLELSPPLAHMLKYLSVALDPYDRSKLTKDLSRTFHVRRPSTIIVRMLMHKLRMCIEHGKRLRCTLHVRPPCLICLCLLPSLLRVTSPEVIFWSTFSLVPLIFQTV